MLALRLMQSPRSNHVTTIYNNHVQQPDYENRIIEI